MPRNHRFSVLAELALVLERAAWLLAVAGTICIGFTGCGGDLYVAPHDPTPVVDPQPAPTPEPPLPIPDPTPQEDPLVVSWPALTAVVAGLTQKEVTASLGEPVFVRTDVRDSQHVIAQYKHPSVPGVHAYVHFRAGKVSVVIVR